MNVAVAGGLAMAFGASAALLLVLLDRGPGSLDATRRGLHVIVAAWIAGLAILGLVAAMLAWALEAEPTSAPILLAGVVAVVAAAFGLAFLWRRFLEASNAPGADVDRLRSRTVMSGAVVEGIGMVGFVAVILALLAA